MQSALFLLAAVACVAFTEAFPVDVETTVGPEGGDKSGIRTLLSDQGERNLAWITTCGAVVYFLLPSAHAVCDYGVPYLEQRLEDLSLPTTSSGKATFYRYMYGCLCMAN